MPILAFLVAISEFSFASLVYFMRFLFFLRLQGHAVKRTRGEWGGLNGALGTGNQVGADIEEGAGRKLRARERKESCGQVEEEEEEEVST